jgi:short-subunit dehydrogenase
MSSRHGDGREHCGFPLGFPCFSQPFFSLLNRSSQRGVTVNAVAPGFIKSDMTDELPEKIVEAVKTTIPAARFGEPDEVSLRICNH